MTTATILTNEARIELVVAVLKNPEVSVSEMAKRLNIARTSLRRYIAKFTDEANAIIEAEKAAKSKKVVDGSRSRNFVPLSALDEKAQKMFLAITNTDVVRTRTGKIRQKPAKYAVQTWIDTNGEKEAFEAAIAQLSGKTEYKAHMDYLTTKAYMDVADQWMTV